MNKEQDILDSYHNPSLYRRVTDQMIFGALRFAAKALYGMRADGLEHFNAVKGKPTVIIANHVSFLDAVMLALFLPVKPAFAISIDQHKFFMDLRLIDMIPVLRHLPRRKEAKLGEPKGVLSHLIGKIPVLRHLPQLFQLQHGKPRGIVGHIMSRFQMFPIDIDSPHSLKDMARLAQKNIPVMIFPEGRLTPTGTLMQMFGGVGAVVDMAKANIVPVYLRNFEHLRFATPNRNKNPKIMFPRLSMAVTAPRTLEVPEGLSSREKRAVRLTQIEKIMHELPVLTLQKDETLIGSLHKAADNFGRKHNVLEDPMTRNMSYGDFLLRVHGLAHLLKPHIPGDKPVGVLLPNSVGGSVSFYALQALGRPAAMLNAGSKAAAIASCVKTADVETVITSRAFIEKAKLETEIEALKASCNIVYLEDVKRDIGLLEKLKIKRAASGKNLPKPDPSKPAVILFTSGSEGVPKGVALSHYNLLANLAQVRSVLGFTVDDRVFNAMPLFHAFGLTGLNLPLHYGAPSYQYPTPLDGKRIPKAAYFNDSTIMFGTDTFLNLYARSASSHDFAKVRMMFVGAERLKDETYDLFVNKFNVRPNQGYGMTEAAPAVTMNLPTSHKRNTVGQFLPCMEWRMEKVEGIEDGGRLFVRGPNVMMGYMYNNNPGVIVPPKDGWHDTGDIVAIDPQGFVSIRGRAKRFAKIGGEMVGLDGIESIARLASPAPEMMHAVILKQDEKAGDSIVLFTTDHNLKKGQLTAAAQQAKLSILGLPRDADIHVIGMMPLLPTGKTDYVTLKNLSDEFAHAAGGAAVMPKAMAAAPLPSAVP